ERPVGDALAVRQRTSGQHSRSFQPLDELAREPALADAGVAVDREQVRAAVSNCAFVGVLEEFELSLAPDERRGDTAPSRRPVEDGADAPGPNSLAEALDVERADVFGLQAVARQPVGVGADQHLARSRGLL